MTVAPECELCAHNSSSIAAEDAADEPASYIQNEQPQQEIYVPSQNLDPTNDVSKELSSANGTPTDGDTWDLLKPDSNDLKPSNSSGITNEVNVTLDNHHQIDTVTAQMTTTQTKTVSVTSVVSLLTHSVNLTQKASLELSTSLTSVTAKMPSVEPPNVRPNISSTIQHTRQVASVPAIMTSAVPSLPSTTSTTTAKSTHTSTTVFQAISKTLPAIKVNKSTISSIAKPSILTRTDIVHKIHSTHAMNASTSHLKPVKPTSAFTTVLADMTTYNRSIGPIDIRESQPVPTVHHSPTRSSTHKAVYAVPALIGLLIVGLIVFFIIYTRRRTRHDNSKQWLKSKLEAKEELLEKGSDIYAQVDLSKKSSKHNDALIEVIPLTSIVIPVPDSDQAPILSVDCTPPPSPTPPPAVDLTHGETMDENQLVENVIYEKPASLAEQSSSGEEDTDNEECSASTSPPPSMSSASQLAPPLMQPIQTSSYATSHTLPPLAEYLTPSCHQHPPQGPNWRPFHDYDPVYVPTSNACAMSRRVDSTGYVRAKPQSPHVPEVYEEINYGAMASPPPLKPRITMGATASGGRFARAPPPLPPPCVPEGNYGGMLLTAQYSDSQTSDIPSLPGRTVDISSPMHTRTYTTHTTSSGAISALSGQYGANGSGLQPSSNVQSNHVQSETVMSPSSGPQLSTRISAASSTGSKDEPQYEVVDFHNTDDT